MSFNSNLEKHFFSSIFIIIIFILSLYILPGLCMAACSQDEAIKATGSVIYVLAANTTSSSPLYRKLNGWM